MSDSSWAVATLADACELITDGTHHSPKNSDVGDFMYVTAKNLKKHGLDLDKITYVSSEDHEPIYRRAPVKRGDVLYIKDGATTGIAVINHLTEPFSLLSSVALIRPRPDLLSAEYLKYWLNSPDVLAEMTGKMAGAAISRLTIKKIKAAEIPLPPLAEQKRIVGKLDSLTAKSARARDELSHIPRLIERYKQAVLAAAFRGDLTKSAEHTHLSDGIDEQAQASRKDVWLKEELRKSKLKGKRLDLEKAARKYQAAPSIRTRHAVREDWFIANVEQLGFVFGGKRLPKGASYAKAPTQHPYIRVTDFYGGTFNPDGVLYIAPETHASIGQYIITSEDVFISIAGTIGLTAVIPRKFDGANLTENAARIVVSNVVLPEFLALFLQSRDGQDQIDQLKTATSQEKLALFRIKSIEVPLPSIEEQSAIIEKIRQFWNAIDRLIPQANSAAELLKNLDQSVLTKAFAGELVPQDPDDEPASVLLERIKDSK